MRSHIPVDPKANLIGSFWMVVAMLGFALEDAMIKRAAVDLPVWRVLVIFGLGGAAVFALWVWFVGAPVLHRDVLSRPMKVRVMFEVLGRFFMCWRWP